MSSKEELTPLDYHTLQLEELHDYLKQAYNDTFATSPTSFWSELKRKADLPKYFSLDFIRREALIFFDKQKAAQAYAKHTTKDQRQHIRSVEARPFVRWQMDLIDMSNFKNKNDGYCYALTVIDVFSKYAYCVPLKSKEGVEVGNALVGIFEDSFDEHGYPPPLFMMSDRGGEFISKQVKYVLSSRGINQLFTYPNTPLGVIERFNKTLKNQLYFRMAKVSDSKVEDCSDDDLDCKNLNDSVRWIDFLQDAVDWYNNVKVHSTTTYTPKQLHDAGALTHLMILPLTNRLGTKEYENAFNEIVKKEKLTLDWALSMVNHAHGCIYWQGFIKNQEIARNIKAYEVGDLVKIMRKLDPTLPSQQVLVIRGQENKEKTKKWSDTLFKITEAFVGDTKRDKGVYFYRLKTNRELPSTAKYSEFEKRKFYHWQIKKA